ARLVPDGPEDKPNFFSPSGIAIHPKTGEIFVISTAKKRLVVLDYTTGQIRFAVRLDKKVMPQPEGISFDAAGNLLISSEGKKGEGLLLKFNYRK
ncbi:MAG: SdiA-regulated domain-containing protein, partial [Saprospiraceae bacterium]|nr:SdiA-regulated domain-containing protein [Saprospiraceae bacterium]